MPTSNTSHYQGGYESHTKKRKAGKPTVNKVNKKVKKIANQLAKQVEYKSVDLILNGTAGFGAGIDDAGALWLLNRCGQGDNAYQRNGSEVMSKSVMSRFAIDPPINGCIVRLLIFHDKFSNSAIPNATTGVLRATDSAGASSATAQPYHPMSTNVRDRFTPLWDAMYVIEGEIQTEINAPSTEYSYAPYAIEKCYRKIPKKLAKTRWINTFTAANDIPQEGAIYLFACSNVTSGSAAANKPNLYGNVRYNYTDV